MNCFNEINKRLTSYNICLSRRIMVQYMAILKCLSYRISGFGKFASAEKASEYLTGRSSRLGRCIMNWTKHYLDNGVLPVSCQSRHQKISSFLRDEDSSSRISEWLRETSKVNRSSEKLCVWANETLLSELLGIETQTVSVWTVRTWMDSLGYKYGVWKKSVYVDGHERSDVVEYRKKFLERMGARLERMS